MVKLEAGYYKVKQNISKGTQFNSMSLISYIKISTIQITNLNVKHKTVRLLKENRRKSSGPKATSEFLDVTPKVTFTKEKMVSHIHQD